MVELHIFQLLLILLVMVVVSFLIAWIFGKQEGARSGLTVSECFIPRETHKIIWMGTSNGHIVLLVQNGKGQMLSCQTYQGALQYFMVSTAPVEHGGDGCSYLVPKMQTVVDATIKIGGTDHYGVGTDDETLCNVRRAASAAARMS